MKKRSLKQFVEWVTAWIKNLNDFQKAKLKISFYYLLVIFLLLNIFAGSIFFVMERESERYQDRIHLYFEGQKKIIVQDNLTIISVQPQVFSFNAGDLLNYHKIFVDLIERWLFEIEALILVLAGFLSYFFAGLSMRTIEEKNERVKKILADVSHELKNPLSGIKLSLEISKKQES